MLFSIFWKGIPERIPSLFVKCNLKPVAAVAFFVGLYLEQSGSISSIALTFDTIRSLNFAIAISSPSFSSPS